MKPPVVVLSKSENPERIQSGNGWSILPFLNITLQYLGRR